MRPPRDHYHYDGLRWVVLSADGGTLNGFGPQFCPGNACMASFEFQSPLWTPNGRQLVDWLQVGDPATGTSTDAHIFRMRLSGQSPAVVVRHAASPIISPDGRLVAGYRRGATILSTFRGRRIRTLRGLAVLAWAPQRR